MGNHPVQWHKDRQEGIGGSDAPAIMGVDRWRNIQDIYLDKTTPVDAEAVEAEETNPDMERGIALESIARDIFAVDTKLDVGIGGRFVSKKHPFMVAQTDGTIYFLAEEFIPYTTGPLEIKCPRSFVFRKIKADGIHTGTIVQNQHYMNATESDRGAIAIFCADEWELLPVLVDRDPNFAKVLIAREEEFWDKVTRREMPDLPTDSEEKWDVKLPDVGDKTIELRSDDDFLRLTEELRRAKELRAQGDEIFGMTRDAMIDLIDKFGVFEGGGARIYYREAPGRKSIETAKLKKAKPLDREALSKILEEWANESDHPSEIDGIHRLVDDGEFDLDFDKFTKQGVAFKELRSYFSEQYSTTLAKD